MKQNFNDFRFGKLNYKEISNKYLTMNRVSEDKKTIVIKVAEAHLIETPFSYAFIIDDKHVVWLKKWQVNINYYGLEVLLNREYWKVVEWGDHSDMFSKSSLGYDFDDYVKIAIEQENLKDKDGNKLNEVKWEK